LQITRENEMPKESMKEIREGAKAPKFKLEDKDGKEYGVDTAKADYTVLYFYPKDDTPGCTIEAQEFSQNLKDFKNRKAAVIGISGGDEKTKAKFCSKYKLQVPLVSDSDFSVSRAYGAYGDKKFMGRSFKGIHRKTFIVDKSGTIAKVFASVKPEGHAEEVLEAIDELRAGLKKNTKEAGTKRAAKKVAAKTPLKKKVAKVAKRPKASSKSTGKSGGSRRTVARGVAKRTTTRSARW
jgi:peroxiredoxin Q/BCP